MLLGKNDRRQGAIPSRGGLGLRDQVRCVATSIERQEPVPCGAGCNRERTSVMGMSFNGRTPGLHPGNQGSSPCLSTRYCEGLYFGFWLERVVKRLARRLQLDTIYCGLQGGPDKEDDNEVHCCP